jgi:hypothetical protein
MVALTVRILGMADFIVVAVFPQSAVYLWMLMTINVRLSEIVWNQMKQET